MKKITVLCFVLFFSSAALAQFEHPDLKSGKKQVRSIILMPVHAEMVKSGMKGAEPLMEESRQLEKALAPVISDVLRSMGCQVDEKSVSPEAFAKDPELGYAVDDLQKQFDAELNHMARKSKDVRKGRFTLGDAVAKLSAGEQADALLFVRVNGEVLTGGKKAFGLLIAGPAFDTVLMHIGVVDAKSGEVLYFARPFMLKNPTKDPGSTRAGIQKSFKNFVKANQLTAAKPASAAAPAPQPSANADVPPAPPPPAETPPDADAPPVPSLGPKSAAPAPSTEPVKSTASQPAPKTGVYFFASRTSAHTKRSSTDVFLDIVKDVQAYLTENKVVLRGDPIRGRNWSEAEFPKEILVKDGADSGAAYVLYILVDRPAAQWVKLTTQCLDLQGHVLWEEVAGSGMGGMTGASGVKNALEKFRQQLQPRMAKDCLQTAATPAEKLAEAK
jgi:hypothetical protein